MHELEIDVRNIGSSCTQHPIIVLANKLAESKNSARELKIYFKARDIPPQVLKLYLLRHGFEVKELNQLDSESFYAKAVKVGE